MKSRFAKKKKELFYLHFISVGTHTCTCALFLQVAVVAMASKITAGANEERPLKSHRAGQQKTSAEQEDIFAMEDGGGGGGVGSPSSKEETVVRS